MSEINGSRRSFLATGFKLLALAAPVAAAMVSKPTTAEAAPADRVQRRHYRRHRRRS